MVYKVTRDSHNNFNHCHKQTNFGNIGVWQGVAMDSLKWNSGPLCLTLLCPGGRPPFKCPYRRFKVGLPLGWAICGHLLPSWTPHAVRLWTLIWSPLPLSLKPSCRSCLISAILPIDSEVLNSFAHHRMVWKSTCAIVDAYCNESHIE
jgi:hypothetical protein